MLETKETAIDLYAGKGGWSHGLLAAGWQCIGFDIADMGGYPAELVLQDVLTLRGSQFRNADLIVASPPCQNYSYLAMPWSRSKDPNNSKAAKALRHKWETEGPDNRLFDACFRIQREACAAAGRYIPLVVENVKGAQHWVGQAKANYGSFFLWGDVETVNGAIVCGSMRFGAETLRCGKAQKFNPDGTDHGSGSWFAIADSQNRGVRGIKNPGMKQGEEYAFTRPRGGVDAIKAQDPNYGTRGWFGPNGGTNVERLEGGGYGVKQNDSGPAWFDTGIAKHTSRSSARKEASARIAMIPFPLSFYIGKAFLPVRMEEAQHA